MNISTDFSIIAEATLIDSEKNSLNIMNVLDGVSVKKLPAILNDFKLVSRFTVHNTDNVREVPLKFKLFTPNGDSSEITNHGDEGDYVINVMPNEQKQRSGIIINLIIKVSVEGEHTIKTFYDDKEIASQVFFVEKAQA